MFTSMFLLSRLSKSGVSTGLRAATASRDASASSSGRGTVNIDEVNKFRDIATKSDWWDTDGPMRGLHAMNQLRVPLIRDGLINVLRVERELADGAEPLTGLKILDVGCGGGLLSERLAKIGASVTGLDAAEENIAVAKHHALKDPIIASRVEYVCGTAETYSLHYPDVRFDAVIASEVIEHVDHPALFVSTCASLLRDGGSFFLTTINRTRKSWFGAIIAAEHVLRLLPKGTHDWNKFITPDELKMMLTDSGCHKVRLIHGMFYLPFVNKWTWVLDTSVNYAVHAIKFSQEKP